MAANATVDGTVPSQLVAGLAPYRLNAPFPGLNIPFNYGDAITATFAGIIGFDTGALSLDALGVVFSVCGCIDSAATIGLEACTGSSFDGASSNRSFFCSSVCLDAEGVTAEFDLLCRLDSCGGEARLA